MQGLGWDGRGLGWRPDTPDIRDRYYTPQLLAAVAPGTPRPKAMSLRSRMPGIYDQGAIGSCTGNALAAAVEYDLRKQGLIEFVPSRLMAYYNARFLENATASDAGASIRDVVKGAIKWGVCSESPQTDMTKVWPYDPRQVLIRPNVNCYSAAKKTLVKNYARVEQTAAALCATLAESYPIVFGATLYESFMSDEVASTGDVPMPTKKERAVGGHALLLVGYDDRASMFEVRNSWGVTWGNRGYCRFPYDYLLSSDLADDLWVANTVGP